MSGEYGIAGCHGVQLGLGTHFPSTTETVPSKPNCLLASLGYPHPDLLRPDVGK